MRIGLITGGGDCAGLNAAIRAVVKHGHRNGHSIVGFRNGWRGVAEGDVVPLTRPDVRNVLTVGGTMLGAARLHPHRHDGGIEAVDATVEQERIGALVCMCGDGTLDAASKVAESGGKVVGITKTIVIVAGGTDRSIGFDTAVHVATEAIDRLHTTAESHNRVMVVEVMGRDAGWIAVHAGMAGGAEIIRAPEDPLDIDAGAAVRRERHGAHASFAIVVVAEGAVPAPGTIDFTTQRGQYGQIIAGATSERVASEIGDRTGFDTRVTEIGRASCRERGET